MSAVHEATDQRFSIVHVTLGALLTLWLAVGVGSAVASSMPAALKLAGLGLWVLGAIIRSNYFVPRLVSTAWPLAVLIAVVLLFGIEVVNGYQYVQGLGYLLVAYSMWCFYSDSRFRRERHLLVLVMLTDALITGVRTLVALQVDPQLSRYLATTEENRTAVYGSQSFDGLGGYGFAYALPALIVVAMYYVARRHRHRALLVMSVAFGLIVVFEMAFTTAIVLAFVLGLVFLVRDLIVEIELRLLLYAAVLGGWIVGLYSFILDAMAGQPWVSADVRQRFAELADLLAGDVARHSDLAIRLELWGRSMSTVLDGGILGSITTRASEGAGGHSQWLDLLASYGIFALLLGGFLTLAWRSLEQLADFNTVPVKRAWVYFLLLGFVNPSLYSVIVLAWMFLVPSLASLLSHTSAKRKISVQMEAVIP